MNQDQPELTLEESIKQVMRTLPPVIRSFLAQGKYTMIAKGLMTKYGLRIDQGGVLEREIMLLLMGIENPDEFTQALVEEARLDQKTVAGIVQDINTQIFVPLREEEMKSKTVSAQSVAAQPARPMNAPVPNYTAPVAELPRGSYAPPPQSPRYPGQENANVNAFVRRVPQGPLNTGRPTVSVIAPSAPAAKPQSIPVIPVPRMPVQSTPPNLPGALPPQPAQSRFVPPPAPTTPYSSDPYHEPIE